MPAPPELIEFTVDDRAPVLDTMVRLQRDRDGWLNVQPDVDSGPLTDPSTSLARVFSARGPQVPLGTWVPGKKRKRGGSEPTSLGLQHAGGPKARLQLREQGLAVPEGWKLLADHPRRGLVFELPDGEPAAETLDWLLRAAALLTAHPLPPEWHAGLFHRA